MTGIGNGRDHSPDLASQLFSVADNDSVTAHVRDLARRAALELRAHQDIAGELRNEAETAARPGQHDRMNALADRLSQETGR